MDLHELINSWFETTNSQILKLRKDVLEMKKLYLETEMDKLKAKQKPLK